MFDCLQELGEIAEEDETQQPAAGEGGADTARAGTAGGEKEGEKSPRPATGEKPPSQPANQQDSQQKGGEVLIVVT